MRRAWIIAAIAIPICAAAAFLLKPDNGPARDLSLVGDPARGAYLIRLGGCVTCHTDKRHSGEPLAGGGPLSTRFGTFYPPNITPDTQTGIGSWTLQQFSDALSNGDGPHGNLYPVFPYNDFTLMSDQEIVDLYAGLMAEQPVRREAPDNRIHFPFNFRILVSGWKNLFFDPHRYRPDPSHSEQWNRGAYLANGPGHCVACHSPRNWLAAVKPGQKFTGNPSGGTGGKAPPITTPALLAHGYTPELLVGMLKTGVTPAAGKVGNEMRDVIEDETSHWNDDDLAALSSFLLNKD